MAVRMNMPRRPMDRGSRIQLWAFLLVSLLVMVLGVAVVLAVSVWVALGHPQGFGMVARLPFVFAAIHLGAGFGVVEELVCGPFRQARGAKTPDSVPASTSS